MQVYKANLPELYIKPQIESMKDFNKCIEGHAKDILDIAGTSGAGQAILDDLTHTNAYLKNIASLLGMNYQ